MPALPRAAAALVLAAIVVAAGVVVGWRAATLQAADRPGLGALIATASAGHGFGLARFEIGALADHWLRDLGALLRGRDDDGPAAERALARYLNLTDQIVRAAATETGGATNPAALRAAQQAVENQAERALEQRVAEAYREAGLARPLPLFDGQAILWPPVDVEFGPPPRVLAVSPRDEIRLLRTVLLDPGLSDAQGEAIEAAIEADGRYAALVDRISGLGAYPAFVRETRSYAAAVAIVAHEWMHHYLYFYRLGSAYALSADTRTINETVANLVADEIAARVVALHPDPRPDAAPPPDPTAADALLRALRLDVDALLAQGRVAEAETRMAGARDALAAAGRPIRRINQAFFAFNNQYADTPGSTSPIGPLLRRLRDQSPSLRAFVEAVRGIRTTAELEARVARGA